MKIMLAESKSQELDRVNSVLSQYGYKLSAGIGDNEVFVCNLKPVDGLPHPTVELSSFLDDLPEQQWGMNFKSKGTLFGEELSEEIEGIEKSTQAVNFLNNEVDWELMEQELKESA